MPPDKAAQLYASFGRGGAVIRHRICPQCSTAVEEDAEVCPGCKAALKPVVHPTSLIKKRSWQSRVFEWAATAILVFLGATALQRYYFASGPDAAEIALVTARGEIAAMDADDRAAFWAAAEVCKFGNRDAVERLMLRIERGEFDPAEVALRCDEIGAQMRRLGLLD